MTIESPVLGSNLFLLEQWEEVRDSGITPTFVSDLGGTVESRTAFIRGAELLGIIGEHAEEGATLHPQQLMVSDMLAAGLKNNSCLLARRSAKTTSLIIEALGRAMSRPNYRVAFFTMSTGKAGRSRFAEDVAEPLEAIYPDKAQRPFRLVKGQGVERVVFPNRSFVRWMSSILDFRGERFDMVILDEAAEAKTPDKSRAVLAAAMPTMDTVRGPQIVLAGTAGDYRDGNALWVALETGRKGSGGILEYSAPESVQPEDLEDWDVAAELLRLYHPGVGNLTTLDSLRGNYDLLTPEDFLMEYLSVFGTQGRAAGLIRSEAWAQLAQRRLPARPKKFSLAIATHPDQLSASIAVAWRDERGKAHGGLLDHRRGVKWLADAALVQSKRLGVPIVHDTVGVVTVEVETLQRKKARLAPQNFRNIQTAAALLVKEIETGNFVHYDQPRFNDAARVVTKRKMGVAGAWGLGRTVPEDDITALEAVAMALRHYDEHSQKKSYVPPEARQNAA